MGKIFISYRRSDTPHVTGRLYDTLSRHFGEANVFYDVDSIPFGVDFRKYLDDEVSRCDAFLVMIGKTWVSTQNDAGERRLDDPADFVRIELESAFKREIPVIPILVAAPMPKAEELPESITELAFRNGMTLGSGADFPLHVERLIKGLEGLLKTSDAAEQPRAKQQEDTRTAPQPPSAAAPAPAPEPTATAAPDAASSILDAAFDKALSGLEALKDQIAEAEEALPEAGSQWAQETLQKLADPNNRAFMESVKAACDAPPSETSAFVRVIHNGDDIHATLSALPPGGILHIKATRLELTQTLELQKRVHIVGAPGSTLSRAMSMDDEADTIAFWSKDGGSLSDLSVIGSVCVFKGEPLITGCELKKDRGYDAALVVSGDEANPRVTACRITRDARSAELACGIRLGDSAEGLFQGNTIYGTRHGVMVQEGCAGTFKENDMYANEIGMFIEAHSCTLVESNQIHDNDKHGVYIAEEEGEAPAGVLIVSDPAEVRSNHIYGNGQAGLFIKNWVEAEHNTIERNDYGVFIKEGQPNVRGNTVRHNAQTGVYLGGSDIIRDGDTGATIESNEISHNGITGILIEEGADPIVSTNQVFSNGDVGVLVRNAKGLIRGNELYDNALAGLQADSGSSPEVSGNTIRHNKANGINVLHSAGVYTSNDIYANTQPGVGVSGATGALFKDNRIHEGTNGVIINSGGESTFEGNTITGNQSPAVAITTGAQTTFRRNTIKDGADAGVLIQEGGRGHFESNTISGFTHSSAVIVQEPQSHGTFIDNTISGDANAVVALLNQADALFERNTITGGRQTTVFVSAQARPEFKKNRVTGPQSIFVDKTGGGRYEGNTLSPSMVVACDACGGIGLIPREKRGFFGKASIERCAECLDGGRVYQRDNT